MKLNITGRIVNATGTSIYELASAGENRAVEHPFIAASVKWVRGSGIAFRQPTRIPPNTLRRD